MIDKTLMLIEEAKAPPLNYTTSGFSFGLHDGGSLCLSVLL